MIRNDLLTNEEFFAKRINQKFACSANRIKFHNDRATKFRHSFSQFSKPVQENLKILNELMANSFDEKFHKQFLIGKGYSLGFFTHVHEKDSITYFALSNYIIVPTKDDYVRIIKQKKW
ncbi:MAG: hypothetical protein CFE24_07250 [Flavobacterium sp. BFFFF2]|nr:MAG: hypothetical protein CFE24_07250 [Flavobacterium sp. BFFFF2]